MAGRDLRRNTVRGKRLRRKPLSRNKSKRHLFGNIREETRLIVLRF